ncbi:MAG: hypothetical protein JXJ04_09130 [Spirochaetales bacterium]|nr:hypothetical protein [Spirochaetales bacterium]
MINNDYYELDVNVKKNRIYWKVKGFWPSADVVPNMGTDWQSCLEKVKKGFTIIADLREMKPPPEAVKKLHEDAQKSIIDTGVSKVATVMESTVTKWSVESITNKSGMNVLLQNFNNVLDAENWLDE